MKKVNWGIISTSRIGTEQVIPAMQSGQYCSILAIASRDLRNAKKTAQQLDIPRAYGSYEELLKDDDIDALYIPLPNHLHMDWTIKGLNAGKHILCEKPLCLTPSDAVDLSHTSRRFPQLKVMEAFMYRHHPQWQHARQLVRKGEIGELRTIHSVFSYYNTNSANIRNKKEMGGGGLRDIGCYSVSLSRFLFGCEPVRVTGIIENDPEFKIDRLASGILDFGSGTSTFTCATQLSPYQRVTILGTHGHIEIEIPFNAPSDRPCRIWHHLNGKTKEILFERCNQYTIQGDLFSLAILNDTEVPIPITDAVLNMKVIQALFASTKSGGWIEVK
jgi:predicted dehydrogenase